MSDRIYTIEELYETLDSQLRKSGNVKVIYDGKGGSSYGLSIDGQLRASWKSRLAESTDPVRHGPSVYFNLRFY